MADTSLTERSRISAPAMTLLAVVGSLIGGTGGAIITVFGARDSERAYMRVQVQQAVDQLRAERAAQYVSRDELARIREIDRDKLDGKLDGIRQQLERVALAVERLRR